MNISSLKGCLEPGPNGQMGVWTRNGGNYAFFTPLSELEKQDTVTKQAKTSSKQEESPEEYTKRKINSHEWMG